MRVKAHRLQLAVCRCNFTIFRRYFCVLQCCALVLISVFRATNFYWVNIRTSLWYWWFPFFLYVGLATLVINKLRQALKQHAVKQKRLGSFFVVLTITAVKCIQVFFKSSLFLGVSTRCLHELMNLCHWPNCVSIRQTHEKCLVTVQLVVTLSHVLLTGKSVQ